MISWVVNAYTMQYITDGDEDFISLTPPPINQSKNNYLPNQRGPLNAPQSHDDMAHTSSNLWANSSSSR